MFCFSDAPANISLNVNKFIGVSWFLHCYVAKFVHQGLHTFFVNLFRMDRTESSTFSSFRIFAKIKQENWILTSFIQLWYIWAFAWMFTSIFYSFSVPRSKREHNNSIRWDVKSFFLNGWILYHWWTEESVMIFHLNFQISELGSSSATLKVFSPSN